MPNPFAKRVTTLGNTRGRVGRPFGIYQSDRLFHMLVLGQTGVGKSTLIKQMIRQDMSQGNGFCLIDPHGDLSEEISKELPDNAIYWRLGDPNCPYGYNPLSTVAERHQPLVASAVIDAFHKQWSDAWGVRMEHLLRYSLLALLSHRGSTLSDIIPLLTSKAKQEEILSSVTNDEVKRFWNWEYKKLGYDRSLDGIGPIANKLGVFLSNPVVKQTLCNPEKPLRFRELMDQGRPLVINLSKGRLGTDVSTVLGGLILSMITQAGLSRETVSQGQRRTYHVFVDEFSNFTTDTIANMLSELRKYRLSLVLAGQYLSSVSSKIQDAILGNVGNLFIFRVGANDAPLLSRHMQVDSENLINLSNHQSFVKLMITGEQSKAFSATTLPFY